ncbi:MAG: glycosyltransferase family 2 protein [Clostridia bacterium]|nr:glycosyltransferase family 2 protein [Clostridia bacterium]
MDNTFSPLISIIMPVFNCEKVVYFSIESVLKQTFDSFEIIVVDDFSTDTTVDVIKSFNDSRIKILVNTKNSGAAYSRNRAINAASGKYIAFLDGDDLWTNDKLELQLAFMIENEYSFSYTNYEEVDYLGKKIGKFVTGPKKVTHRMFKRADFVGCLTVMYRRDIYPDLQIPNDIYKRNDYALWLLLSKKANCYLLSKTLAYYRRGKNTISSGGKSKLFPYHVALYKKVFGYSTFKSFLCASRNVFYYIYKKIRYVKNVK